MGKTASRVAVSAYAIEITKTFTPAEWNELESALGQVLSEENRSAISHLTDDFLNFRRHEGRNVPTIKEVREKIDLIRENAHSIISAITVDYSDIVAQNTAAAHAARCIRSTEEGDAALIGEVQAVLRRFIVSCDQAREGRPEASDHGYQAGDAWKTTVWAMHRTLDPDHPPGKGIGNNAYPMSPITKFIEAWENLLPGDARKDPAERSPDALQAAVNRAIMGRGAARDK
ncbi:hypothetical protein [Methylobacterium longum]|uniref:Uncharacterized protein n=1 Tax=Methylobacterium longum TaxID=767694 RepID=A0ABT8ATI8_9HYPH|nr:hypothetical protein [Methylobacterium longum]MDN3573109.1 hypothetical protein [Methylobacterium longum]GJE12077.1 hypothetical protein FOHLNKBM_3123 [Methylobacterium longum]